MNPPVAGCWLALTGVYHLEPTSHSVRLIVVRGAGASLPEPCALSATAADAYGVNLTKRTGGLYPGRASVCRSRLLGRLALDANRPQAAVVSMRDDFTVVFGP